MKVKTIVHPGISFSPAPWLGARCLILFFWGLLLAPGSEHLSIHSSRPFRETVAGRDTATKSGTHG
jgi:hypothetical protein